ncbi:hypothetical protein G9A89_016338 [Geosiphon pyriformis]|nr:hypothetical protein G9A89_016338 [Geosiphon pyriformis]
MAYTSITKIEKFTDKENDTQVWLNNMKKAIAANEWNNDRFIHGLCSSILQYICPMHPQTFQDAVTNTQNFKSTELKANHAQAVNLLEKFSAVSLFSKVTLEEKLITAIYTDVKVDGHFIKLILDSGSAGSIITKQLMNQLGY